MRITKTVIMKMTTSQFSQIYQSNSNLSLVKLSKMTHLSLMKNTKQTNKRKIRMNTITTKIRNKMITKRRSMKTR